jgi:hypothetical protein
MKTATFKSRVQALPVRAKVNRIRTCAIRAQQSAPVLIKSDGTRYTIEKARMVYIELILLSSRFTMFLNIFLFFPLPACRRRCSVAAPLLTYLFKVKVVGLSALICL